MENRKKDASLSNFTPGSIKAYLSDLQNDLEEEKKLSQEFQALWKEKVEPTLLIKSRESLNKNSTVLCITLAELGIDLKYKELFKKKIYALGFKMASSKAPIEGSVHTREVFEIKW